MRVMLEEDIQTEASHNRVMTGSIFALVICKELLPPTLTYGRKVGWGVGPANRALQPVGDP